MAFFSSPSSAGPPGSWNPHRTEQHREIPATVLMRIRKDLKEFYEQNMQGIHMVPDESDITKIHALITGPADTPYQYGFFYFFLRLPTDYPLKPPKVILVTTGRNTVRFNPNLYNNGKVCLSILGTWSGPQWSPVWTLSQVLLAIQSLMNDAPLHNEPGYEKGKEYFRNGERNMKEDVERYNEIIRHETIRVAVLDMMGDADSTWSDAKDMPQELKNVMKTAFIQYYHHYVKIVKEKMHLNNQQMKDPFGFGSITGGRGPFVYQKLLERLEKLKAELNKDSVVIQDEPIAKNACDTNNVDGYDVVKTNYSVTEEPEPKEVNLEALIEEADYFIADDDDEDNPVDLVYEEDEDEFEMVDSDDGEGKERNAGKESATEGVEKREKEG